MKKKLGRPPFPKSEKLQTFRVSVKTKYIKALGGEAKTAETMENFAVKEAKKILGENQ